MAMDFPYRDIVIDELGKTWRQRRGIWQLAGRVMQGRWVVNIRVDGAFRIKRRGQLVYMRFYGPIPEGYDVHHKDEDKLNDDPINLELKTHSQHLAEHKLGKNWSWSVKERPKQKRGPRWYTTEKYKL